MFEMELLNQTPTNLSNQAQTWRITLFVNITFLNCKATLEFFVLEMLIRFSPSKINLRMNKLAKYLHVQIHFHIHQSGGE